MENNSKSKKYVVAVDGSESSDVAFHLVLHELLHENDKIDFIHISNPDKKAFIPYEFQPQTIISNYDAILTSSLPTRRFKIIAEFREKNDHAIIQVNNLAKNYNADIIVLGYHGHKGNKQKNISGKGVDYIIEKSFIPTLIVKEKISRQDKKNGKFTWVVMIRNSDPESRSFKAFQFAMDYIKPDVDRLIGVHVKCGYTVDKVKKAFVDICKEKKIADYGFKIFERDSEMDIGQQLTEFVNYNEDEVIDFIVMGLNPNKIDSQTKPLNYVVKNAMTNVMFSC